MHQAVTAHADWIIDLGPGAGHDGGRIVFEGAPADLVAASSSLTGHRPAPHGLRRRLTGGLADTGFEYLTNDPGAKKAEGVRAVHPQTSTPQRPERRVGAFRRLEEVYMRS